MIKSIACALALAVALSGSAFAATMSKSDMTMMKKCQGMSQSMMMKNKKCVALMKKSKMSGGSMSNGKPGDNSSGAGKSMGGATSK